MELLAAAPAVVCCRCSPEQKAVVVRLVEKRAAAKGDGGNDVSMIQAASVEIGVVGKEGRQASLAADFSFAQFNQIGRLVHGRNSYKRFASLSQFVMHRGLIIIVMQVASCLLKYFFTLDLSCTAGYFLCRVLLQLGVSIPGFLMVGYATIYTMLPVFSLVIDKDVPVKIALTYPELYRNLTKGRSLSYKTFFIWVLVSIYQGGVLCLGPCSCSRTSSSTWWPSASLPSS